MAWIYLKYPPCPSAPEAEGSISRSNSGSIQSLTASSIPMRKEVLSQVSVSESYPMLRFGMTSPRFEVECFPELTRFTVALPAKTSALPVMVRAWEASEADLCLKPYASLASADLESSCWRTSQGSLFGGLTKFCWDSMRSGMMRGGLLFQPKKWEPRSSERDCSSWPRPVASDTGTWNNRSLSEGAKDRPSLGLIAKRWPRPLASDCEKGGPNSVNYGEPKLSAIAARWARPTARDWKGQESPERHGEHSPSIDIQAHEIGHTGYLSPHFHAAMMGYSTDHTQLDAVGMAWFLFKQKKLLKD